MEEEKKSNKGGARVGAGRKKGIRIVSEYAPKKPTLSISGTKTELNRIRQKAKEKGISISSFLIEAVNCADFQN